MFFSFSPTVVIYYCMRIKPILYFLVVLHALTSCTSSIEWEHIIKLFKLVKRPQAICTDISDLFKQYDMYFL